MHTFVHLCSIEAIGIKYACQYIGVQAVLHWQDQYLRPVLSNLAYNVSN